MRFQLQRQRLRATSLSAFRFQFRIWTYCLQATLWRKAYAASKQAGRFMFIEEDTSNYYIVSEKCHGGSLQQMLDARGALTEAELTQVAW